MYTSDHEGANFCAGDLVTVFPGFDTPGIDFRLDRAGSISGTVYESDGSTPIAGVTVNAWNSACDNWWPNNPMVLVGSYEDLT